MKRKIKHDKSNWPIAAGLFIGLGAGLLTGQIWGCMLIGFGLGILVTYLISRKKK